MEQDVGIRAMVGILSKYALYEGFMLVNEFENVGNS